MPRKIALFAAALLMSAVAYQAAAAADLSIHRYGGNSVRYGGNGVGTFHTLGFWGETFPYGYRWSVARACTRYESVETRHGVRKAKVWVCADRWHYYR